MKKEDKELATILGDIAVSKVQQIAAASSNHVFMLSPHPFLIQALSGWIGALLVRAILHELHIDEHHIFKWSVENKWVQYALINYYAPGVMPKSYSFSKIVNRPCGVDLIRRLLKRGFFIKATLGHGSGRTRTFDRTSMFDYIINHKDYNHTSYPTHFSDKLRLYVTEKWILQEKINLKMEFRVHSFSTDIIHGLSFKISGVQPYTNFDAEEFVSRILEKLPNTLLNGTLIAWDIGLDDHNKYQVIEANFTGFHPYYIRGFQTTGYVEDDSIGPIVCAWINNFFRNKYKITISSVTSDLLSTYKFLKEFLFYESLFNHEQFKIAKSKRKDTLLSAIVYFGNHSNELMIRLITFLQLVDFAERYYVIVPSAFYTSLKSIFDGSEQFNILVEEELFTIEQYQLIQQLDQERRKQISCYHVLRKIDKYPYVMF